MCVFRISLRLTVQATPTNCTNDVPVVTAMFELPNFAIRVINAWNSLPADHVDFSSFAYSKRTVEQIDFTPFLLCYRE